MADATTVSNLEIEISASSAKAAKASSLYLGKTAKAADSDKLDGMDTTGSTWPHVVTVQQDGVSELGKYLDFHTSSNNTDYDMRITANGSNFDFGSKRLSGLATPTATTDAATKLFYSNNLSVVGVILSDPSGGG